MNMERIVVSNKPLHHITTAPDTGPFDISDCRGLRANKLRFQAGFTILQKHRKHLAKIRL